jgi:hypothetical protein
MRLLFTSFRVIVMVESDEPSGFVGPVPVIVEFAATAVPAVNVTVPPVLETGVAMARVFTSALVDFTVQVETPLAFELEQAV